MARIESGIGHLSLYEPRLVDQQPVNQVSIGVKENHYFVINQGCLKLMILIPGHSIALSVQGSYLEADNSEGFWTDHDESC